MIHLYTGDGKGKTTAAIGQVIRAAGRDIKVYFAQFMKGNDTGELHILEKLPGITILRSEKDFGFYNTMTEADKQELTAIHNRILDWLLEALQTGDPVICILDEVTYPVKWNLLDREKLRELLDVCKNASAENLHSENAHRENHNTKNTETENSGMQESSEGGFLEIVMTGRDPANFLYKYADYITEMKAIRHPYEKGITARRGIEF